MFLNRLKLSTRNLINHSTTFKMELPPSVPISLNCIGRTGPSWKEVQDYCEQLGYWWETAYQQYQESLAVAKQKGAVLNVGAPPRPIFPDWGPSVQNVVDYYEQLVHWKIAYQQSSINFE